MVATGGCQAPTIRYRAGTFYIICTNVERPTADKVQREQFIIQTSDIWSGQWSDPVLFDFNAIDASLFWDDDDRVYFQAAYINQQPAEQSTTIYQFELDISTGKKLSEPRKIWDGHFRIDTEGPHIYKRGKWYYLLVAEGGTFEYHKLAMARSTDIWGPYETFENNPILTAEGSDDVIQGLGHGELFQDGDGDWWLVGLGNLSVGRDKEWPLGRQSFLTTVDWPVGGWPKVKQPALSFPAKSLDCVDAPRLASKPSDIVYIRGREDSNYDISTHGEDETIALRPGAVGLHDIHGLPTFYGRRQPDIAASATVVLDLSQDTTADDTMIAGLTAYLDPFRYVYLVWNYAQNSLQFGIIDKPKGVNKISIHHINEKPSAIQLSVVSSRQGYTFSFVPQTAAGDKQAAQAQELELVPHEDLFARYFTGPLFGIFAEADGDTASVARFRNFRTEKTEL